MVEQVETVIVGGGQAGLSLSHELVRAGREHVVLERGRLVERWRSERWVSLTLLSPNSLTRLPGHHYRGPDPDGFMGRDEVVRFFEDYAASFDPPVQTGVTVIAVDVDDGVGGYLVRTDRGDIRARNVVLATGTFQKPRLPQAARDFPPDIVQVHSSAYRNPEQLPPGAVLVVGSGASGFQIAEELNARGRRVYFSLGRQFLLPRRYRGQDILVWGEMVGLWEQAPPPPAPGSRGTTSPALTGVGGGHDLDPRRLAADGAVLLGHVVGLSDGVLAIAPDLPQNIADGEAGLRQLKGRLDGYIQAHGLDAHVEPEPAPLPKPAEEERPIERLDLRAAGITSVVWATGFELDMGWVHAPIFDGPRPVHEWGVTPSPGLYALGLPPIQKIKVAFILGLEEAVDRVAEHLLARVAGRSTQAELGAGSSLTASAEPARGLLASTPARRP